MSNPFDDDGDSEILEGFLCPICKIDLKTPERLTNHVENQHAEEQDLLKSLKDIFSIAKKKLLNLDDEVSDLGRNFDNTLRSNFSLINKPNNSYRWENYEQEIGVEFSHYVYFKSIRNPRLERYATETNKLIIRLHKLLTDRPTEPIQRRQHEQRLVSWLDGKTVNLCPNCAKTFHLARRQHHCRLCGSIMCNDCSRFLDIDDAINLVNPSLLSPSTLANEIKTKEKESNNLRVCHHCLHLIENRKEMQDSRTARPIITKLFDRIDALKKDIHADIPMYRKIINSLYEGDSIFRLSDASALHEKIGRTAEQLDTISKEVQLLQFQPGCREEALKKSLRLACIQYIKEQMLSIPKLPSEAEIKKLQEKRSQELVLQIQRERQIAQEAFEKYELEGRSSATQMPLPAMDFANGSTVGSAVRTMDNWSGYASTSVTSATSANIDPLIEQINIIKGYIKQARAAMRFEEVATLELNLRELQKEFYIRQQESSNFPA